MSKMFFATPRWASYGGMFESIFLAVNLARVYGRKILFFYPKNHFDRRLEHTGFHNRELSEIVVNGELICEGFIFQSIIAKFLELNRWSYRCTHLWARMVHLLLSIVRKLFLKHIIGEYRYYFGYCGAESAEEVGQLLGISCKVNWKEIFENPTYLDITEKQKKEGLNILQEKLGIPSANPFVCLYVRDDGFELARNIDRHSMDNASIEDFGCLISYLDAQGYYVIRVGDPKMVPFKGKSPKFIDYVHTNAYCELMDLFLYRHCAFWVGTMGGARSAPMAYGRSCVVVNGISWEYLGFCINQDDIFMHKHIYSKHKKKFLSIQEQLNEIEELGERFLPKNMDYIVVANTPQENATAVEEFYQSKIAGDFDWNIALQKAFYDLWHRRIREAFYDKCQDLWDRATLERYVHVRPYISQAFLENCWEETDYLRALSDYFNHHNSLRGFQVD